MRIQNKKGLLILKYLFWLVLGLVLGLVFLGKFICKYWCGC